MLNIQICSWYSFQINFTIFVFDLWTFSGCFASKQLCMISFPNMFPIGNLLNMFNFHLVQAKILFSYLICELSVSLSGCFMDEYSSNRSLGARQRTCRIMSSCRFIYLFHVKINIHFTFITMNMCWQLDSIIYVYLQNKEQLDAANHWCFVK